MVLGRSKRLRRGWGPTGVGKRLRRTRLVPGASALRVHVNRFLATYLNSQRRSGGLGASEDTGARTISVCARFLAEKAARTRTLKMCAFFIHYIYLSACEDAQDAPRGLTPGEGAFGTMGIFGKTACPSGPTATGANRRRFDIRISSFVIRHFSILCCSCVAVLQRHYGGRCPKSSSQTQSLARRMLQDGNAQKKREVHGKVPHDDDG